MLYKAANILTPWPTSSTGLYRNRTKIWLSKLTVCRLALIMNRDHPENGVEFLTFCSAQPTLISSRFYHQTVTNDQWWLKKYRPQLASWCVLAQHTNTQCLGGKPQPQIRCHPHTSLYDAFKRRATFVVQLLITMFNTSLTTICIYIVLWMNTNTNTNTNTHTKRIRMKGTKP